MDYEKREAQRYPCRSPPRFTFLSIEAVANFYTIGSRFVVQNTLKPECGAIILQFQGIFFICKVFPVYRYIEGSACEIVPAYPGIDKVIGFLELIRVANI